MFAGISISQAAGQATAAAIDTMRGSGERSAPGTLDTKAATADAIVASSKAASDAANAGRVNAALKSARAPTAATTTPAQTVAPAIHWATRIDGAGSGVTGSADRASWRISSSIFIPLTSEQSPQHAIAAMGGDLHGRLRHPGASGDL